MVSIFWLTTHADVSSCPPQFLDPWGIATTVLQTFGGTRGTNILATHISIDYTKKGVIYAFNCEYPFDTNTFLSLKKAIEVEMKVHARRLKIQLIVFGVQRSASFQAGIDYDENARTVRLIIISLDPVIRGMTAPRKENQQ